MQTQIPKTMTAPIKYVCVKSVAKSEIGYRGIEEWFSNELVLNKIYNIRTSNIELHGTIYKLNYFYDLSGNFVTSIDNLNKFFISLSDFRNNQIQSII